MEYKIELSMYLFFDYFIFTVVQNFSFLTGVFDQYNLITNFISAIFLETIIRICFDQTTKLLIAACNRISFLYPLVKSFISKKLPKLNEICKNPSLIIDNNEARETRVKP
ncbi:hypothetical protein FACS189418_0980 [Clostridia bacterium]|nr:hypothetical protein FACS189418_0980 [Clostridia bacterium]